VEISGMRTDDFVKMREKAKST